MSHKFITFKVNADKLISVSEDGQAAIGHTLSMVLAQALNQINSDAKQVIYINKNGDIKVHPTDVGQPDHLEFDHQVDFKDIFKNSSVNQFAIVGDLVSDILHAMSVDPDKSIVAFTYSEPETHEVPCKL